MKKEPTLNDFLEAGKALANAIEPVLRTIAATGASFYACIIERQARDIKDRRKRNRYFRKAKRLRKVFM